jgi:hypothetical protein
MTENPTSRDTPAPAIEITPETQKNFCLSNHLYLFNVPLPDLAAPRVSREKFFLAKLSIRRNKFARLTTLGGRLT